MSDKTMLKKALDFLKDFGIKTEKELDSALERSAFSLGIMAAVAENTQLPFGNMKGDLIND
jgi:phosphoribosylcarboxyaminoimidazole (NCAIR) mutase